MGAGRKTQTISAHDNTLWSTQDNGCLSARKLRKGDLCGVIFGCTHETMDECLSKQLFGLPYAHICYVKNIGIGIPLFLFNYSDRKLHGIYEAASPGQTYIDDSAWTGGSSQRSPFPAQVRIRTMRQCEALVEKQYKKAIEKNYFSSHHFWNELDKAQTIRLMALFKPSPPRMVPPVGSREEPFPVLAANKSGSLSKKEHSRAVQLSYRDAVSQEHQNSNNFKQLNNSVNENKFASLLCNDEDSENDIPIKTSSDVLEEPVSDWEDLVVDDVEDISSDPGALTDSASHSSSGCIRDGISDMYEKNGHALDELPILAKEDHLTTAYPDHGSAHYMETSHESFFNGDEIVGYSNASELDRGTVEVSHIVGSHTMYEKNGHAIDELPILAKEDHLTTAYPDHGSAHYMETSHETYFNGDAEIVGYSNASDLDRGTVELVHFITELKERVEDVKKDQAQSYREICHLRNQLWCSDRKIGMLEDLVKELGSKIDPSKLVDESLDKFVEQCLGSEDVIYLIGGFDGYAWSSALDSFSPSLDLVTPLKSMSTTRSYASAVALANNLFVFGGRSGASWIDTVEYYNRRHDEWVSCPSMIRKKGSLCGVTLNGTIYAIGGGDGVECLSDVEMFDPAVGKWIANQPMLCKRFAFTAAELEGVIYALGGYDGKQYLRSVEKFDPREGHWTKVPSMNTSRGSHAAAVLNQKLYCIGGYDGQKMIPGIEVFDPRLNCWVMGEPMGFARGCCAATVLGNSLYVIGGVDDQANTVDTVECYSEDIGWKNSGWKAIGKRSFLSAIVL